MAKLRCLTNWGVRPAASIRSTLGAVDPAIPRAIAVDPPPVATRPVTSDVVTPPQGYRVRVPADCSDSTAEGGFSLKLR